MHAQLDNQNLIRYSQRIFRAGRWFPIPFIHSIIYGTADPSIKSPVKAIILNSINKLV